MTIDSSAFKNTMRQLASGVVVLTTRLHGRPHATTATAFLPLSADPPLALACIHRDSDTHLALSQHGRFGVNILSSTQAALSTRFAGRSRERYHFEDVPRFDGPNGCLLFRDSAAHLELGTESTVAAGDHTIFIGGVLWLQADAGRAPLIYHQGAHYQLQPFDEPALLRSWAAG